MVTSKMLTNIKNHFRNFIKNVKILNKMNHFIEYYDFEWYLHVFLYKTMTVKTKFFLLIL